jgi:hypothetical protein
MKNYRYNKSIRTFEREFEKFLNYIPLRQQKKNGRKNLRIEVFLTL